MKTDITRRKLFTATGVAAAGVLGAGILSGCSTDQKTATIASLGNPKELAKTVGIGNKWNNTKCVQLGDSITWYDGQNSLKDGTPVVGYASYLRGIFKEVDNYGVSGASIAYHKESKYEDVVETVEKVDFSNYGFCTLAAGANDVIYQFSPLGELTNGNYDKTTFYGAYQYIIEKILKQNPNIQLMMVTPLKAKKTSQPGYKNKLGYTMKDFVEAVKKIAEHYSIPILDFYSISGFNPLTFDTYTIDGLHPSNKGFQQLSLKMVAFINTL